MGIGVVIQLRFLWNLHIGREWLINDAVDCVDDAITAGNLAEGNRMFEQRVRMKNVVPRAKMLGLMLVTVLLAIAPVSLPPNSEWQEVAAAPTFRLPWEAGSVWQITVGNGQGEHSNAANYHGFDAVPAPGRGTDKVVAVADGTVMDFQESMPDSALVNSGHAGNCVIIDHGGSVYSIYAHLAQDSVPLSKGQSITSGTVIGTMGNSGFSTGPHLHWAVVNSAWMYTDASVSSYATCSGRTIESRYADNDAELIEDGGVPRTGRYYESFNAPGLNVSAPTDPVPATCNDAGVPQQTSRLTASPQNLDTATEVMLSVTITNNGCGTFAPTVLAIGGRDPAGNVTDPYQTREFVLGPGESTTLNIPVVLSTPGTHEFFMAHQSGGWHRIPDTNGDSSSIFVTVTEAVADNVEVPGDPVETTPETPPEVTETPPTPEITEPSEPTESGPVIVPIEPDDAGKQPVSEPPPSTEPPVGPSNGQTWGERSGPVDIAIYTMENGASAYDACYVLVGGHSLVGCDENGDGKVTFADIPLGTYTVRQTADLGPGRYVNDFTIQVSGQVNSEGYEPFDATIVSTSTSTTTSTSANTGGPPVGPSGSVDIALITRDPSDGSLLRDTCYVLVGYSIEGCDENGDGQVTFADIPDGTYTVRQTRTPAGYQTINDYTINVDAGLGSPIGFIVKQAPDQNAPNSRNVSVVFIDSRTGQKVVSGICVELVGASLVGCDEDLIDGQIDFLDVPAGTYDVQFSNLPAGWQVLGPGMVGVSVTIDAGSGAPTHQIIPFQVYVP